MEHINGHSLNRDASDRLNDERYNQDHLTADAAANTYPGPGPASIPLRVAEAYHRDAGKGVARINVGIMTDLGLENGGVVEIKGKDKVYAIAWPGNPEDPADIIRIDGNTRANLGTGIDNKVQISRAQARPARKVVVAPTRQIRFIGGPQYLLRMLEGRAVVKGEMLRVEMINNSLSMAVVSTMPSGLCGIISSSSKSAKVSPM